MPPRFFPAAACPPGSCWRLLGCYGLGCRCCRASLRQRRQTRLDACWALNHRVSKSLLVLLVQAWQPQRPSLPKAPGGILAPALVWRLARTLVAAALLVLFEIRTPPPVFAGGAAFPQPPLTRTRSTATC